MNTPSKLTIRPLEDGDREWVRRFIVDHWGAELVVAHGEIFYPHKLPGLAAYYHGILAGLLTYHISEDACEIVTIDSLQKGSGAGTALIQAVREIAQSRKLRRLWLITTNDNLDALRFYQRRGFCLAALRPGAIERSRRLKPEIPLLGNFAIPIRDELELEIFLE